MKKYCVLDQRATVTVSAPKDEAAMLDAALAYLCALWDVSVSKGARIAIMGYLRGIDIEQAAGILALARFMEWVIK